MSIYANTTSAEPTHFLAALQLIQEGRKTFQVSSENWPYPTAHKCGTPKDKYYAEIWVDGMDWQHNYWIIESLGWEDPKIYPLIYFKSHDDEGLFNFYDFRKMMEAILHFRRDKMWLKTGDQFSFNDTVWPFIFAEDDSKCFGSEVLVKVFMEHASQKKVVFFLNAAFFPLVKCFNKNRSGLEKTIPTNMISEEELKELAKKYPPPQSWYDEKWYDEEK